MMMNFKSLTNLHAMRTLDDENVVIVSRETNDLYRFQPINSQSYFQIDNLEIEKVLTEFEIRYDLVDTGLYICTPALLNHFTENFDFHSLRDEFLKDFLTSKITIDTIQVNELHSKDYCGKIVNYRTYW